MTEYQQKDGEGVLFKNNRATKETHPQYTGSITVKGTKFSLAAWVKESRDGSKRLSLSIKPWEDNAIRQSGNQSNQGNATQGQHGTPNSHNDDFEDTNIPF